ncbi:MAG: class I SAM-dependent methyltransferase [Actinomycetota bacterium]
MNSDMWDERYAEKELIWSAGPNLFLPPIVERLEVGSALDLACGEGRNAIWLARKGWDVTGVDFSPVAIDKARTVARDTSIEWIVADITSYEAQRQYDLVIIVYVHMGPEDMAALFTRAVEALAPGGTLVAIGHALRNLAEGVSGPQNPELLWTKERIAPLVDGLEVRLIDEVLRPVEDSDTDAIDILIHAVNPNQLTEAPR